MKPDRSLLLPISSIFTATLLIANTLDTKIFELGGLALPAGIVIFPLAYVFGDILTEVYGFSASRRVIWTGFAALLLMIISYEVARGLPPAGFWQGQAAFDSIFSHIPRIVLASMSAYLAGEFINSFIVARMKVAQQGRQMGLRFVASTFAGQAVDTTVFVLIAFAGTMPASALASVIVSAWAVKVGWEILALPITLALVRYIKKAEGVDVFDTNTNFTPFKL